MIIGGITGASGVSSNRISCLAGTLSTASFHKKAGDIKTFVAKPLGMGFTGGIKMEILDVSDSGGIAVNLSLVPVDLHNDTKAETLPSDISITKGTARGGSSQTINISSTPLPTTLALDEFLWLAFRAPGKSGSHIIVFSIVNGKKNLRVIPTNYAEGVVVIE